MASAEAIATWRAANQAYLVAEFARLASRLQTHAPKDGASAAQAAGEIRSSMQPQPAIDQLAGLFGLTEFERQFVLLCAGVEMDSNLATACAENQANTQKAHVTFGLALAFLDEPHWGALTPVRPLRRYRMVEVQGGASLTSAALRIDERILHFVAGLNVLDPRLEPLLRAGGHPDWIADEHRAIAERVTGLLKTHPDQCPLIHLCGDDSHGQEDVASFAAGDMGRQLVTIRGEVLPAFGPDLEMAALLWEREALLLPGALLLQCGTAELTPSARYLAERTPGFVFLASREPVPVDRAIARFDVNKPGPVEQKRLWKRALAAAAENTNRRLDDVAEQFRLSAKTIYSTASLLTFQGRTFAPEELWNACRSTARPKLENLAERIVPGAEWDDLVLPELQKQVLHQLAAQVRFRMRVYEDWGFSQKSRRGLGVSALFAGASGTGKTMAADVLAHDLGLDLYRIDLSAVVSKYIGETEKNLKQVFDAAEEGGVLLLFDEADALFGKRSEVRDSHDRYANIEVGYLLQRMEAYQGLAILTTNLKSALDTSFQRRLRFTVNFPFPDAAQREAIWRRVFPQATPTRGLDYAKLAQLNVTGGNIRNIAVNAAFMAAQSGGPVEMAHLAEAARLEALKIERALSEAEMRGWVA
jgi:hypothetical protein